MKLLNKILIISFLVLAACSSKGTINVGNPDIGDVNTIKVGKLSSNGTAAIIVSVDVFGGESELDTADLIIHVNSVPSTVVSDLRDFLDDDGTFISFSLERLSNGDILTFQVKKNGTVVSTYEGTVSSSESTDATLEVGATTASSVKGIFVVDEAVDTCTTDGNPVTDDFGIADPTDRDELCLDIAVDGTFNIFELNDDTLEVLKDYSGRTLKFTFQEALDADQSFSCTLTYSTDGQRITGQCKNVVAATTYTCTLAYVKTTGNPETCSGGEGFVDLRAIQ